MIPIVWFHNRLHVFIGTWPEHGAFDSLHAYLLSTPSEYYLHGDGTVRWMNGVVGKRSEMWLVGMIPDPKWSEDYA